MKRKSPFPSSLPHSVHLESRRMSKTTSSLDSSEDPMLLCRTIMPRRSTCFDFCTSAEFGRRTHLCRSSMRAASRDPRGYFSFDVQPVLLAVFRPRLFQRAGLVLRSDSESAQRQYQGTHTNVGFCCPTRWPTPAASDDRCLDVTAGPNPLQHSIQ